MNRVALVVFGGLPGTGKTTVSRLLASEIGATFLRVDEVEQAIRSGCPDMDVGVAGYSAAQAVAGSNLELGRSVVADCVNPVQASRDGWRATAERAGVGVFEVEVICSDIREHERRVQARSSDVMGLKLPTWEEVRGRAFEPWDRERLVLDTSTTSVEAAVARIRSYLRAKQP